jgi:lysophospholipid acyltransferase (LPLAT)-like uncharacterized protein
MIRLTPFRRWVAVAFGHVFSRWLRSLRVRVLLADGSTVAGRDFVAGDALYAITERDINALAGLARGRDFHVLVAEGNDGDWATAFATPLECQITRGSSLHHPIFALLTIINTLKDSDAPAALVVDGPLGPAGETKEGIVAIAACTGRPIVPAAAAAKRKFVFTDSWAAHELPLPFSSVVIAAGPPITVRRDATRAEIKAVADMVSRELQRLRARATEAVAA